MPAAPPPVETTLIFSKDLPATCSALVAAADVPEDGVGQSPVYVAFEATSQGAPNMYDMQAGTREAFRRSIGRIGVRKGIDDGRWYIYGLVASGPDALWDEYGTALEAATATFRLKKPSKNFRSPEQNSWEFV